MYNLFLKDFYLVRKHLWIAMFYSFMMFFIFNSQIPEVQGTVYAVGTTMIGYTMIMYSTAYDDKNNSEVLLNSLPISRNKIVLSKYISIFVFAIVGILSMTISGFVLKSLGLLNVSRMLKLEDVIGAITGLCFITFLYLPIYFKYGYIKAKMFNLILFAIAFGGPMLIGRALKGLEKPLWIDKFIKYLGSQSDIEIGLFIMIIIITLGLISFGFSIMAYGKREF